MKDFMNKKFGYVDSDNIATQIKEVREYFGTQLTNIIYEDIKTSTEYRVLLKLEPVQSISIICALIDDIATVNKMDATHITKAIHDTFRDIQDIQNEKVGDKE